MEAFLCAERHQIADVTVDIDNLVKRRPAPPIAVVGNEFEPLVGLLPFHYVRPRSDFGFQHFRRLLQVRRGDATVYVLRNRRPPAVRHRQHQGRVRLGGLDYEGAVVNRPDPGQFVGFARHHLGAALDQRQLARREVTGVRVERHVHAVDDVLRGQRRAVAPLQPRSQVELDRLRVYELPRLGQTRHWLEIFVQINDRLPHDATGLAAIRPEPETGP